MAANTTPIYPGTINIGKGKITGANTARDGSGSNIVTCFTAGSNAGSRVESIRAKAQVTTTAGCFRVFLHDGSTFYLFKELAVPANTASASNPAWEGLIDLTNPAEALLLPTNWTIRCAMQNAEATDVIIVGGDY